MMELKNVKKGIAESDCHNLKVTLDLITKMNYNDFNQVGDKKQIFDPMTLLPNKQNQKRKTLSKLS